MASDEDDQLAKNGRLFFYVRDNKNIQEKKGNIEDVLKDGADVNACDMNNNNNTCLHIAVRKMEKDVVELLVAHGALLYFNKDDKSPIDIAKEKNHSLGNEIAEFLEANATYATKATNSGPQQIKEHSKQTNKTKGKKQKKGGALYSKRVGTSGAGGQFYETKILSLVLYRSQQDPEIDIFYVATNIKDIGDFDDVCFRCKLKNRENPILMFLQAKHRDDPEKGKLTVTHIKNTSGDFGLGKYFDSFLRIRQKFSTNNPDPMFEGEFKDLNCHFILYTPVRNNFDKKRKSSELPEKIHSFINTWTPKEKSQEGKKVTQEEKTVSQKDKKVSQEEENVSEVVFQYENDQSDIGFLTFFLLEQRVNQMALDFLDFIMSTKEKYDGMMTNHLIKIFHPALARYLVSVSDIYAVPPNLDHIQKNINDDKNFNVSEIQTEKYRIGLFRSDFFYSSETILLSIKETLCKAIVINHCKKTKLSAKEIKNRIKETLNKPCSETISRLIGEIVTFDDKNVRLLLNESTVPQNLFTHEDVIQIKNDLLNIQVNPSVVKDAIIIAGKPKLESLSFKLPTTFGNSDLSIRGNDKKNEKEKEENYVDFVSKLLVNGHTKLLVSTFLDYVMPDKSNYNKIMNNPIIQIFHQDLVRHVILISETFIVPPESLLRTQKESNGIKKYQNHNMQPEKFCLGQFKTDFFEHSEENFIFLKETLCEEIVVKHCKETILNSEEIKIRINEIINKPCAITISSLIGEVIIFDRINKVLIFNESNIRKNVFQEIVHLKNDLLKVSISSAIVKEAIVIAGIPKLKSLIFKLPYNFGKSALSVKESESNLPEKVLNRIYFLAKKILALIEKFKDTKIIFISNETVGPGKILETLTLETNGGIGGAVGNLLILDHNSGMLVFNTAENTLPIKAKLLLQKLKSETQENLSTYKISVNLDTFPRYYFHATQYEQNLAQEFLDRLWFYTSQAKEEEVERILKNEIDKNYNADKTEDHFLFRAHSDAIFLRFHDEIQKWWKLPTQAPYLTKKDKVFDLAKKDILDKPLLTVLNVMCVRKLKKIAIKFKPESIEALELNNHGDGLLNIITDAVLLSAVKINQAIRNKNNNTLFINLQYLFSLPYNDYNTVMDELKETKETTTLIIINETHINSIELRNKLNNIFVVFKGIKIILITEKKTDIEADKYFAKKYYTLKDEYVNLTDLTTESQSKFLLESKIIYQGEQVPLNTIIDETSNQQKRLVRAKLLSTLTDNKKVEIGFALSTSKYEEIRDCYINRPLIYNGVEHTVNKLNDIADVIVIISGKPGFGKTMLLTHLAVQTKKDDPRPWIVRVHLSNHGKDFGSWNDKDLDIDTMMKFLCPIALSRAEETKNMTFYENKDERVSFLRTESNEASFQLELFINFYNDGKIIFLFDGFDRTYPEHTKECIKIFKLLANRKKRLWITTSTYFSNMLEREFGVAYKLDRLSTSQQQGFLHRFWKTNMKLEKLNHEQFNNITYFYEFISKTFNIKTNFEEENRQNVTIVSLPLHIIYVTAVEYFKNELINLSPKFIRDKFKQKWHLDSFTGVDRYLRELKEEEERSSELAGTPLHMYVAASYFQFQITDRLILDLDKDEIEKKFSVYLNAATCYETLLLNNMKQICEIEDKASIEKEQDKIRDDFFEKHKKLALYAICKESDIAKLLTEADINEVKTTIKRIESGEEQTALIDYVIDGVPIFYNAIFAEYFAVEFASHLLKAVVIRDPDSIKFDSVWDTIVNGLLLVCPPGVRNAFEYKLKYDPELVEAAGNDRSKKIIFNLISKQENASPHDANTTLNAAINDGLVNLSSLLLSSAKNNITSDNMDVGMRIIKSGALLLSAVDPSWKEVADNVVESSSSFKAAAESVEASQIEEVSRSLVGLFAHTDAGKKLNETIKTHVSEPVKKLTEKVIEKSDNNENLVKVVEQIACRLPDVVNSLFGK